MVDGALERDDDRRHPNKMSPLLTEENFMEGGSKGSHVA
jgi:hypothetical protein